MAKQTINIGAAPNDGTGTPLRTSFDYCNQNFTELYTATGPSGNNIVVPGSATITGDLTVATDRLKVVTGSTAVQTGATTQLQVGTTSWPSTVIGKSGSRSLFGNTGEVVLWTEAAPAIGNYSTLFVTAKTGAGATTMGGLQIRAGIENASNSDGFVSLWTSNSAAGGFVERYKIDSTGVATWSNVGGVGGTAMTLNSTGLGVGRTPATYKFEVLGNAQVIQSNFTDVAFRISQGASTSGNKAQLLFTDSSGTIGNITSYGSAYGGGVSGALAIGTGGTDRLTVDSSGNVGIGVTPSAWGSGTKALEFANGSVISFAGYIGTVGTANSYYNGSNFIFKTAAAAARYDQDAGQHKFYRSTNVTPSAGGIITFEQAMTLDASGRLLVGNTSAFTDLTGSKEVRIGDSGMQTLTVASLPAATATNIARGGVGGLVYVGGFNGTGQYGAVVLWTAASATVVSVINGTGSTITFGVSAGFLQITSSLVLTQVTASCIRI